MTPIKGPVRWAANFIALSALLHLVAAVASGYGTEISWLIPLAVLYAVFAYGLFKAWRWMAYIAFVVVFVGTWFAIGSVWSPAPVFGWIASAICLANVAAIVMLFVTLWKPKPASQVDA